ncbi:MAG: glycosyltransferase [Ignavibacterium sp.]|nr:glycosyltransferase [Ignavibacterium sp.]MDW8375841.1 glycosyltransferase [Ignavibacteriales bacterium]
MTKKKALIAFLGNINYDTRCFNLFNSLKKAGYEVEFIGFDWLTKNFTSQKGEKTIYKLVKKSPSLTFYFKFYSILKLNLLIKKYDLLFAEDLYTLPACIIIGKLKRAKIIYDSRELFGFLAGLKDRPFIQFLWQIVEKIFIKKSDLVLVTGLLDELFLQKKYNISNTIVIRNLPLFNKSFKKIDLYDKYKIDESKKILVYQGVVVKGRGIRIIFDLLKQTDEYILLILGDGEDLTYFKELAISMSINHKVIFVGKIPQEELLNYTSGSFVGLSLIENLSLSYYYALPNKLFEYIMAEIPVIVTNLPQMKSVIDEFQVGYVVEESDIESLKAILQELSSDKNHYEQLKLNCRKASEILCWEKEFTLLNKKLQDFLS